MNELFAKTIPDQRIGSATRRQWRSRQSQNVPCDSVLLTSHMSGLCNRLRGLAAMRVVAEVLDVPFHLNWIPNWACPASFCHLFEPLPSCEFPAVLPLHIGQGSPIQLKPGAPPCQFHKFVADRLEWTEFRTRYSRMTRELSVTPRIMKRIQDFVSSEQWARGPVIGLHVRRTDLIPGLERKIGRHLDDEPVFTKMREYLAMDDRTRFFLATDNRHSQRFYVSQFGDRVFVFSKQYSIKRRLGDRQRHTTVADAVVDLYCLARCERIIGTKGSSFSGYAAVLGNVPIETLG